MAEAALRKWSLTQTAETPGPLHLTPDPPINTRALERAYATGYEQGRSDTITHIKQIAEESREFIVSSTIKLLETFIAYLHESAFDLHSGYFRINDHHCTEALFLVSEDDMLAPRMMDAYSMAAQIETILAEPDENEDEGISLWISFMPLTEHTDFSALYADFTFYRRFPEEN